tara:strand:+ start:243 stop:500 length:258 start_codon:yes stop_codon:yes gene_type:complete
MKYKISKNIIETRIGNDLVILELEKGNYIRLNNSATLIWEKIKLKKEIDQILRELNDAFSNNEALEQDVKDFCSEAVNNKILIDS